MTQYARNIIISNYGKIKYLILLSVDMIKLTNYDYPDDKIMMLDCTFRDGGYLNNWDFSYEDVFEGYKVVSESNYDYFEIGFRSEYDKILNKGRWIYSTEEDIGIIKNRYPNGCKIAVMAIVGQNDVNNFKPKCESHVDLIRILLMRNKSYSVNECLFFC